MELASPTAERVTPEQRAESQPSPRAGAPKLLTLAAALGAIAAALWIGAVALTAGHGFDISDEGYYLLSYRWWDTNFRTFTGIQYLYGPVFEALGFNIAGLRLFRLFTVIGAHLVFGWTFMGWLRERRPTAPPSRLWEFAGVAAILAAGGLVYGWLPLSPGYNDVSLLGSLLAASVIFKTATLVDQGRPIPIWAPASLGPLVVVMVFAKWTSAFVTFGLIALVGIIVLKPRGIRQVLRFAGWAIVAAVLTVALIQVAVVPLTTALPEMLRVNGLAAANTNSPVLLLKSYWNTSVVVLNEIIKLHWLLFLAAAVSLMSRRSWVQICAGALTVAGLLLLARRVISGGGLAVGSRNLDRYPISVLATLTVVVLVGLGVLLAGRWTDSTRSSLRRESGRGWTVLGMILLLPFAQAMGTGNPIYMMAINAFAAWMALMIAILTGIEKAPLATRALTAATVVCGVIFAACVGIGGVWLKPYRTASYAETTAIAAGVPALGSVRLDPTTAEDFSLLYERLKPYVEPDGRAIMAFDEMAGVVLLLGGRSVGEAWYSDLDRERTARGIMAECGNGRPWWGERKPLLLFRRAVSENEVGALKSCGLVFATDYRLLGPKEETMGLLVYVPTAEVTKE